jgi:hypothetical protein
VIPSFYYSQLHHHQYCTIPRARRWKEKITYLTYHTDREAALHGLCGGGGSFRSPARKSLHLPDAINRCRHLWKTFALRAQALKSPYGNNS